MINENEPTHLVIIVCVYTFQYLLHYPLNPKPSVSAIVTKRSKGFSLRHVVASSVACYIADPDMHVVLVVCHVRTGRGVLLWSHVDACCTVTARLGLCPSNMIRSVT
jgi:hypothetical protein